MPIQSPKKEQREEANRRERDKIKFIDLKFERAQVVAIGKEEEGKIFHALHVLGMNDLWDRVDGLGSETWNGC